MPKLATSLRGPLFDRCHPGVSDSASRGVHDTTDACIVTGIEGEPEVGDHVLDLFAFVEALTADEDVGDPKGEKRFFKCAALRVRSIQDREVAELAASIAAGLDDGIGDKHSLVALGSGFCEGDRCALGILGPKLLGGSAPVLLDNFVCCGEDRFGGAGIPLELYDLRVWVVGAESQDQ